MIGTPDCIATGERPGLPIVLNQSAACAKVLPDLCYAAEDDILFKTNVTDCVFAKKAADIIFFTYESVADGMLAAADFLGPDATVTGFDQPNALTPAGVIGVVGTTAVLFLTGTTTKDQLAVQGFYFGTGPINQGLYSCSAIYESAALLIADQLNAAGAGTIDRIVMTGHSYGGAVCMVLAAKMRIANPTRRVEMLTLGAPKPGDRRLANLIEPLPQSHYANERDCIPFLPPKGIDFAALFGLAGLAMRLLWGIFVRPRNVIIIHRDGKLEAMSSDDIPDDLILNLATVIIDGRPVPSLTDHQLDWYSYYLCNACTCVPRPCFPPYVDEDNFQVQITFFEFKFDGVVTIVDFPYSYCTVTNHAPTGKPNEWLAFGPGPDQILIVAGVDGFNNYTDFTLYYQPNPPDPVWLCLWEFTVAEMLGGVQTSSHPTTFHDKLPGDGVITLGELRVVPFLA